MPGSVGWCVALDACYLEAGGGIRLAAESSHQQVYANNRLMRAAGS